MASSTIPVKSATEISTGITGVKAWVSGNVVTLKIAINTSITTTTAGWKELGTLPDRLMPPVIIYFPGYDNLSSNRQTGLLQLAINASGIITVYLFANESARPYATVTYCV